MQRLLLRGDPQGTDSHEKRLLICGNGNVPESPPINLLVPLKVVGGPVHEYDMLRMLGGACRIKTDLTKDCAE